MGYDMRQQGFVLIVSLIFLVLMTMLGLAMFSGFITNQMVAGNHREKSRAFDAAQTAINFTEYWLAQPGNAVTSAGKPITGKACAGISNSPVICNNALTTPATLPWATGVSYTPSNQMAVNAAGGKGTYAANPQYYIQYLGQQVTGPLFQVTAAGQGGNANSVAVLQTVFQITVQTSNVGGG